MPDHSIHQRQAAEVVGEQGAGDSFVQQSTQSKLAQLRAITRLGLVEYDLTQFQVRAYLAIEGRRWQATS
jgi:hypothetical protein